MAHESQGKLAKSCLAVRAESQQHLVQQRLSSVIVHECPEDL